MAFSAATWLSAPAGFPSQDSSSAKAIPPLSTVFAFLACRMDFPLSLCRDTPVLVQGRFQWEPQGCLPLLDS